jgi:DNA-directed RNA polymerase subunit RPC12/RpoP
MTARLMWTNAHDLDVRVIPGPSRWYRCPTCKTRWRAIGRWVRRTTRGYRCPGCRQGKDKEMS